MSNGNLVPRRITDKNGVTKTHWVKPGEDKGVTQSFPSPVESPAKEPTPIFDDYLRNFMMTYLKDELDAGVVRQIESLLVRSISDTTASRNMDMFVRNAIKQAEGEEDTHWINDVAALGEAVAFNGLTEEAMSYYVNGLHRNQLFAHVKDFWVDATDEERAQAGALCSVTNALPGKYVDVSLGYNEFDPDDNIEDHEDDDEYDYYLRIKPELSGLIHLIMENHERASEITAIIKERGSVDVEMIQQIIGSRTQALREGTL